MTANRRHELTARVLALCHNSDLSIEEAIKAWYQNFRSTGGYRLNETGYRTFQAVGIENWQVPVQLRDLNKRALLDLDRKLDWPYYIDRRGRRLIMFSSRDAMMATLYGDIQAWLANTNREVDQ